MFKRYFIRFRFLSAAILIASTLVSAKITPSEYEVKAVILVNFLKYVTWPTDAFSNDDAIAIGILGENPFGGIFQALQGQSVAGRRLDVRRFSEFDDKAGLLQCNLVYIGSSDRKYVKRILEILADRSILTVSESNHFVTDGGMISLFTQNNRIRFDINQQAATNVGLEIGSELLRNARDVIRKE